jgi:hypothetical protein
VNHRLAQRRRFWGGIWVPDSVHEAVRDLTRARKVAMLDLKKKRQHLLSFLLRHDRNFPGGKNWTKMHERWLAKQTFNHPAQQIVFQDHVEVINAARVRLAAARDRADLDNGAGSGSLPSPAGRVFPCRDHLCCGGWRCTSLCDAAAVDGFSRPGCWSNSTQAL